MQVFIGRHRAHRRQFHGQIAARRLRHIIVYHFCLGFGSAGDKNAERTASHFLAQPLDQAVGRLDRGGAGGHLHDDIRRGHQRHGEAVALVGHDAVDQHDAALARQYLEGLAQAAHLVGRGVVHAVHQMVARAQAGHAETLRHLVDDLVQAALLARHVAQAGAVRQSQARSHAIAAAGGVEQQHVIAAIRQRRTQVDQHGALVILRRGRQKSHHARLRAGQHAAQAFGLVEIKVSQGAPRALHCCGRPPAPSAAAVRRRKTASPPSRA
ncbi:hypothetical protein D3C81_390480 [compost metagenome]